MLFNGATDTAYTSVTFGAIDFTDANGFFVVGDSAVSPAPNKLFSTTQQLQKGADAVALYSGSFLGWECRHNDEPARCARLRYRPSRRSWSPRPAASGTTAGQRKSKLRRHYAIDVAVPDGITTTAAAADRDICGSNSNAQRVQPSPAVRRARSAKRGRMWTWRRVGQPTATRLRSNRSPRPMCRLPSIPTTRPISAPALASRSSYIYAANALIPQTVNVTAVDDASSKAITRRRLPTRSSSADTRYNGFVVPDVVADIVDNDAPVPTSIVISELMYDPASVRQFRFGEWIEIVNNGAGSTDLSGWLFDDEDATNWGSIPSGTIISANQVAVFFDSSFTDATTFRAEWSVPASALVVGISWGSLGNSPAPGNEVLATARQSRHRTRRRQLRRHKSRGRPRSRAGAST